MRPIERGSHPIHPETQAEVAFRSYKEARGHLTNRIGWYCSYCERRLEYNVAIEHISPKSKHPSLALAWDNFLLACVNCNSIKNDKDINEVNVDEYIWPDKDNTFMAIDYGDGLVTAAETELKSKAQKLIELVGLDRTPESNVWDNPEQTDTRSMFRREAWDLAVRYRDQLSETEAKYTRNTIVDLIVDLMTRTGYWSVWMSVFKSDSDMLGRFIEAMLGTSSVCFDEEYNPVCRPIKE